MPSILIRDLPQTTKDALKLRSVQHKRSMEEEARQILNAALKRFAKPVSAPEPSFFERVNARFKSLSDGESLVMPKRAQNRPLPVY